MNSSLRNGLLLVTAVGTMMFPGERVRAADNQVAVPEVGTSKVQNETYSTGIETAVSDYLAPTIKGEYFKMAFTNVDADTFLFIRSEPSRESEWVGKLYPGSASEIIGPVGEWTRVQSGSVTGYVLLREKKPGNGRMRLCPNRQLSILRKQYRVQNPEKRKKQGWQRREKRLKKKRPGRQRSRLLMYRHLDSRL